MDVILVSNYLKNQRMFSMLDTLARTTFGIELKTWKEEGFLGSNYVPYSYVSGGRILANVSANLYRLRSGGKEYPVVQIGTVMTDPSARGHGLSGRLMRYVVSLYEKETLCIFLFANPSVMDFYPRFGFSNVAQKRFVFRTSDIARQESDLRPVSWLNAEDRELILSVAGSRVPTADEFSLLGEISPRTICFSLREFEGTLHYSPSLDAVICLRRAGEQLQLAGFFPRRAPEDNDCKCVGDRLLAMLPQEGCNEIECEFTLETTVPNVADSLVDARKDGFFIRASDPLILPGGKRLMPQDPSRERRTPLDLSNLRISEFDHT